MRRGAGLLHPTMAGSARFPSRLAIPAGLALRLRRRDIASSSPCMAYTFTHGVSKSNQAGASLRGANAAPPMSKTLWRASDWEPPCPLRQPSIGGARAGCPGWDAGTSSELPGPHAAALASAQPWDPAAAPRAPLSGAKQSKGNLYFMMFKVTASWLFLRDTAPRLPWGRGLSQEPPPGTK